MVAAKVTFMRGMNPVPSERLSAAWGPTVRALEDGGGMSLLIEAMAQGARLRERSAGETGRLVRCVRRA